jgi:hypothetical protein
MHAGMLSFSFITSERAPVHAQPVMLAWPWRLVHQVHIRDCQASGWPGRGVLLGLLLLLLLYFSEYLEHLAPLPLLNVQLRYDLAHRTRCWWWWRRRDGPVKMTLR